MHQLDREAGNPLATTEAIAFKVDQVYYKAIKGELKRRFKERVLALSMTVEESNLPTEATLFDGLVKDRRVLGELIGIDRACDIVTRDFDTVSQHDILIWGNTLKHVQPHLHVLNVIDGQVYRLGNFDLLLLDESVIAVALQHFAQ